MVRVSFIRAATTGVERPTMTSQFEATSSFAAAWMRAGSPQTSCSEERDCGLQSIPEPEGLR
jgi:hypothetical protein